MAIIRSAEELLRVYKLYKETGLEFSRANHPAVEYGSAAYYTLLRLVEQQDQAAPPERSDEQPPPPATSPEAVDQKPVSEMVPGAVPGPYYVAAACISGEIDGNQIEFTDLCPDMETLLSLVPCAAIKDCKRH